MDSENLHYNLNDFEVGDTFHNENGEAIVSKKRDNGNRAKDGLDSMEIFWPIDSRGTFFKRAWLIEEEEAGTQTYIPSTDIGPENENQERYVNLYRSQIEEIGNNSAE
jgi:hypothetical protein